MIRTKEGYYIPLSAEKVRPTWRRDLLGDSCVRLGNMEVTIRIPDEVAQKLSADRDVSRQILEAFAPEGYP